MRYVNSSKSERGSLCARSASFAARVMSGDPAVEAMTVAERAAGAYSNARSQRSLASYYPRDWPPERNSAALPC